VLFAEASVGADLAKLQRRLIRLDVVILILFSLELGWASAMEVLIFTRLWATWYDTSVAAWSTAMAAGFALWGGRCVYFLIVANRRAGLSWRYAFKATQGLTFVAFISFLSFLFRAVVWWLLRKRDFATKDFAVHTGQAYVPPRNKDR